MPALRRSSDGSSLTSLEAPALSDRPLDRSVSYYCVKAGGTLRSGPSTSDIHNFAWDLGHCYATIAGGNYPAISQLTPGGELWIDDGTHVITGSGAKITTAHSGTAEKYTVIRARNHSKAVIYGTAEPIFNVKGWYIQLEGLRFLDLEGDAQPICVYRESRYVKVKRCSANCKNFAVNGAKDVLFEDCYIWGGPLRYPFQNANGTAPNVAERIIYRRCVVRWDYSNVGQPLACFGNYIGTDIAYQNCISIDGTDYAGVNAANGGLRSFFCPNGCTNVSYVGCISLNMYGGGGYWIEGTPASGSLSNCIAWGQRTDSQPEADPPVLGQDLYDAYGPKAFASTSGDGYGVQVDQCTFGDGDIAYNEGYHYGNFANSSPIAFDGEMPGEELTNSIIYGMALYDGAYAVSLDHNPDEPYEAYNCFYGNTGGRNCNRTLGEGSVTTIDPITQNSLLKTAGMGGARIGARIWYKVGRDGTLWGEPGWDEVSTHRSLWPFPYEDEIREACAAFHKDAGEAYDGSLTYDGNGSPEMDGARGFCSGDWTLTTYIQAMIPIGVKRPTKPAEEEPEFSEM